MALKAMNIKLEERKIDDVKNVAAVFHMTITEVFNEALDAYLEEMKKDPLYRLTANIETVSDEENKEIMDAMDDLSAEDLEIASVKKHTVKRGAL